MQSSITSRVIFGEEGAENAKKLISVKTSCRRQFFKKIEITNCGLYLVFAPYAHTLKIPCFAPEINSKVSASFCLDVQTREPPITFWKEDQVNMQSFMASRVNILGRRGRGINRSEFQSKLPIRDSCFKN